MQTFSFFLNVFHAFNSYWSSTCLKTALRCAQPLFSLPKLHTTSTIPSHALLLHGLSPQITLLIIPKTSACLASPDLLLHQKGSTASVDLASLKLHEKPLFMHRIKWLDFKEEDLTFSFTTVVSPADKLAWRSLTTDRLCFCSQIHWTP